MLVRRNTETPEHTGNYLNALKEVFLFYLSIFPYCSTPSRGLCAGLIATWKSDARTEKVKGDSVKRTNAEFKKQVQNSFIVVLWQAVVQGLNCHTGRM